MGYTPTQWVVDDTVTAAKMNKIEHGIASHGPCVMYAHITMDEQTGDSTFNKTWNEINEALQYAVVIVLKQEPAESTLSGMNFGYVYKAEHDTDEYTIEYAAGAFGHKATANAANDYPVVVIQY